MTDSTRNGLRFNTPRPWSRDFFRILSWNIERGLQFPKIVDFLQTIQADILGDSNSNGLRFNTPRPWSRDFFRILSWNIERGLQFPKIVDFLQTIQADLLLLQEVDLNARRTRYRDIASELARCLNLDRKS